MKAEDGWGVQFLSTQNSRMYWTDVFITVHQGIHEAKTTRHNTVISQPCFCNKFICYHYCELMRVQHTHKENMSHSKRKVPCLLYASSSFHRSSLVVFLPPLLLVWHWKLRHSDKCPYTSAPLHKKNETPTFRWHLTVFSWDLQTDVPKHQQWM